MDCIRYLLCSRPMNGFVTLNCNCPCYIPRPHLRFLVRLLFSLSIITLWTVAITLYALSNASSTTKTTLVLTSGISTVFPILAVALDFYQCRVWWHYRSSCDNLPSSTLSPKHVRYIPYHLIGKHRSDMHMGNELYRSMQPPQMLGFGVYFARSIGRAEIKARFDGALTCAEVRMGRAKQVTRSQIHTVSNSKA